MPTTRDYSDVGQWAISNTGAPFKFDNYTWFHRQSLYNDWWEYFSGDIFDTEDQYEVRPDGEKPLLYPLKLNLVKVAALLHANASIGETTGKDAPVMLQAKPRDSRGGKVVAEKATELVSDYFETTELDTKVDEFSLAQQVFGGSYWRTMYDPQADMGVRLVHEWPESVWPVWYPYDRDRIAEIFVMRMVSKAQAEACYGVKVEMNTQYEARLVQVLEHWTEREYDVKVNDQVAKYPGTDILMQGENPWGFVPFDYVPRLRTGEFYGDSLVPDLMGIQDEYNLRMADLGDAVVDSTHKQPWVKNRKQGITGLRLNRKAIMNLGQNPANWPEPEIDALSLAEIPENADMFFDKLMEAFRILAHTPPVVYGIDEGSQRSALTLAFRMYPFVSVVHQYRRYLAPAYKRLAKKALTIMRWAGKVDVPEKAEDQLWDANFPPVMPRDREQMVNEQVLLVQGLMRSPEHALEKLGDDSKDIIKEEMGKIEEFARKRAEIMAGQQQGQQMVSQEPVTKVDQPVATPSVKE